MYIHLVPTSQFKCQWSIHYSAQVKYSYFKKLQEPGYFSLPTYLVNVLSMFFR